MVTNSNEREAVPAWRDIVSWHLKATGKTYPYQGTLQARVCVVNVWVPMNTFSVRKWLFLPVLNWRSLTLLQVHQILLDYQLVLPTSTSSTSCSGSILALLAASILTLLQLLDLLISSIIIIVVFTLYMECRDYKSYNLIGPHCTVCAVQLWHLYFIRPLHVDAKGAAPPD